MKNKSNSRKNWVFLITTKQTIVFITSKMWIHHYIEKILYLHVQARYWKLKQSKNNQNLDITLKTRDYIKIAIVQLKSQLSSIDSY